MLDVFWLGFVSLCFALLCLVCCALLCLLCLALCFVLLGFVGAETADMDGGRGAALGGGMVKVELCNEGGVPSVRTGGGSPALDGPCKTSMAWSELPRPPECSGDSHGFRNRFAGTEGEVSAPGFAWTGCGAGSGGGPGAGAVDLSGEDRQHNGFVEIKDLHDQLQAMRKQYEVQLRAVEASRAEVEPERWWGRRRDDGAC